MRSSYPYMQHCLCLLPSLLTLGCLWVLIGNESDVYRYFTLVREANPGWTLPMEIFTHGTLFLFYPVYGFFLFRGLKNKRADDILFCLCYLIAQLVIAALLCRVVKIAVGRPRPMTGGPFVPFSFGWGYQSFPSGHAGEIMGSCLPIIWRYWRVSRYILPLGLGVVVAAVSFSRVYLSMHHPTDIMGGLVFGSLSGYASWALYGFLRTRWQRYLPHRLHGWLRSS